MIQSKIAKDLIQKAKRASTQAYAPYSNLKVGAALLGDSGHVWTACNVENSSYGLTICAERNAVTKAISEGARNFKAIAITCNSKKMISPCGACLQFLSEFNPELCVIIPSSGGKIEQKKVKDLLPCPFM